MFIQIFFPKISVKTLLRSILTENFLLLKNSDKDIDERINEEKRNTDKYEVKLRNAQNKVRKYIFSRFGD